jgi:uncharacterized protein YxjI
VAGVAIAFRLGREVIERVALDRWGLIAIPVVLLLGLLVVGLWRYAQMVRTAKKGGEFTPADVVAQLEQSGLAEPAFEEDGTILGASVLVVNQRPKVLEVNTDYSVFDRSGHQLGSVRQVDQSRAKQLARLFTAFDQFFTHRFHVVDTDGNLVLRLLRPRKVFYTKLHVYDANDTLVGSLVQENVFWKIRFRIVDPHERQVGRLAADNLRAWDFTISDAADRPVAQVFKSWEGWAKATFTRADHYVVRIGEELDEPLRTLAVAGALAADLALKQDNRR